MQSVSHTIKDVLPGSIAFEMGIEAGDSLLSIDGNAIIDVLDYRFKIMEEEILIEIEKHAINEIWELEIEKDSDEDLGLVFDTPLMSKTRICQNKCLFCFVDQQPSGLRNTLYVKDDDPRLSFLLGNYVTLTNVCMDEVRRLASFHLSPIRISVHAADLELRSKMMGTDKAKNLFDAIHILNDAGILMHFQAVICKGINDGKHLALTIEKLSKITPGASSLAIVPVGLTQRRQGLYPLLPFTKKDAQTVIQLVEQFQEKFIKKIKTSFVFLSDEWYIMGERPLPPIEHYEDFPQLDNGVGMLRLFEHEFKESKPKEIKNKKNIGLVTGKAAVDFIKGLALHFENIHPNVKIKVFDIKNEFLGTHVTVSGLLTGQDIIKQLKGKTNGLDCIFVPQNAFRHGTQDMLDGCTRQEIEDALNITVKIGSSEGEKFYKQLEEI